MPGDDLGWDSSALAYRTAAAVVASLDPPSSAVAEHARLVLLLEQAADVHDSAGEICERMSANMIRESAGLEPEPGDDNCFRAGFDATEAEAAVEDGRDSLAHALD